MGHETSPPECFLCVHANRRTTCPLLLIIRGGFTGLPQSDSQLTQFSAASTEVARADLHVAFVSPRVDPAIGDGVFHCAMVFVRVCAVREAAAADVGP